MGRIVLPDDVLFFVMMATLGASAGMLVNSLLGR